MLRSDYHTHTPLCKHAEGEPEAFVAQAIQLGLHSYGIADHAPMPPELELFDDWRMLYAELPLYKEWIMRAKKAAAHTPLRVLSALECDWLPGIEPWIQRLRQEHEWDYLIGSVHYLPNEEAVDNSIYADSSITGSVEEDWKQYWASMQGLVESGLFDVVGHIDLVKIWGRSPQGDLSAYYRPTLDALEGSGMAVEINTAGWHKKCREQYPSEAILTELLRRRIPILINADAHYPEHLSRGWDDAIALLQRLTNNKLTQFEHPVSGGKTTLLAYGSL